MTDKELTNAILKSDKEEDKALSFIYNHKEYRQGAQKVFNSFKNIKIKTWLDIFHDSIIQLIKSIHQGKYNQESSLMIYFFGIYRNKCREALRLSTGKKAVVELPPNDIADLQSPLDVIFGDDLKILLRNTLDKLDEKCKQLLTLWADNHSMKEITEQMALSSNRIAITYNARCKKRLIKLIAADPAIEQALNEYRWI